MKVIAKVHEKGDVGNDVIWEFDSFDQLREFAKVMQGVLIISEAYYIKK